jgi:AraC family transcriptional regulator
MKPRIQTLSEKKLVGMHQTMSLVNYKIGELWRRFSPRRNEITNNLKKTLSKI